MEGELMSKKIRIKYSSNCMEKIKPIKDGNWIDLRSAESIELKAGEFKMIPLGVAMELPEGYEAHVVPRSSTFKNYGLIQTNHMGVIDTSYCGDNDWWHMPVIATRDVHVEMNDRICQFRIVKSQPDINFVEVNMLGNDSRGGFGSTGRN